MTRECKDAISRADARYLIAETNRKDLGGMSTKTFKILYDGIDALPLVTPKPKTGHWIRMKAYEKWGCSECSTVFRFTFKEHNYCPNCGAKMQEVEE